MHCSCRRQTQLVGDSCLTHTHQWLCSALSQLDGGLCPNCQPSPIMPDSGAISPVCRFHDQPKQGHAILPVVNVKNKAVFMAQHLHRLPQVDNRIFKRSCTSPELNRYDNSRNDLVEPFNTSLQKVMQLQAMHGHAPFIASCRQKSRPGVLH